LLLIYVNRHRGALGTLVSTGGNRPGPLAAEIG